MSDTWFELRSGRKLGISGFGDPKSRRIVLLSVPPPGSGAFDPDPLVTDRFDVHVVVVDRPGHGGSDSIEDAERPSVTQAADDIADYLSESHLVATVGEPGIARAVGVVGWGWGGATALSFAARNPLLVDRVTVVGTPSPARSRHGESSPSAAEFARPRFISSVSTAAESLSLNPGDGLAALGVREDDPALDGFGVRNRLNAFLEDDRSVGLAWDRLAARDTRWARELRRIRADTLLIYGDMDPVTSRVDAIWYRKHVPHSRLVLSQHCGRLAIVQFWDRILRHVATEPRSREADG
ncbi:MAG TPA: alpha/beta hydrolase [Galbitalea sp.]|nr:alpha/beta hydrolase [Galbitalea sp.]